MEWHEEKCCVFGIAWVEPQISTSTDSNVIDSQSCQLSTSNSLQNNEIVHLGVPYLGAEQEVAEGRNSTKRLLAKSSRKRKKVARSNRQKEGDLNSCPCQDISDQSQGESQSRIGDLVLAAALMENTSSDAAQHAQDSVLEHDHGGYSIPEDTELLKYRVKELKESEHELTQHVTSLQSALDSSEKRYHELQDKSDSEKWMLSMDLGQQLSHLESENRNLRCQKEILEMKNLELQEQLSSSSRTVLYLSQQLKDQGSQTRNSSFSLEAVKAEPKWVRFYTGFESYECLLTFLAFLTADKELCTGRILKKTDVGPHTALSQENQLFLVLTRLRLGLLLQDLAFRFRVSESTVSRYWLTWTDLIHARLTQIPIRCSSRYVDLFEPKRIMKHHERTLIIMDCTDLFFEVQAKDRVKSDYAHPCRNHYLRHGYAIASSNGYIGFCSSLPFGIATKVMDGLSTEDLPGRTKSPPLVLPPFLQEGPIQLTPQQQETSRQVLSIMSLIDKALNFRFLKAVYPQSMEVQVDRVWTICCYLACLLHEPMGLP